jgi:phenylacetate-coenzyme A ligase PaaK-like adenylate-forming protein
MFPALTASAAGLYFMSGLTGSPYPDFPVHRSSTDVLAQIENLRPQIVTGIASFLRRLFIEAAERKFDLSSIYLVIPSGETLTESMRVKMHECLSACGAQHTWIGSAYGFTEGGIPWTCCHENGGLHTMAPDQVYLEILDPGTYERLPDGQTGLVALTHLNRRGMPLVRYLLGDLGAISNERCEYCGREVQSLLTSCGSAHITRTNDLIKIKGVLVNPECIHDVVFNTPGVLEYQVTLENRVQGDPDSGDLLKVFVALDHPVGYNPERPQPWIEALRAEIFNASEVHPEVVIVSNPNEIYNPERNFKAKRFIDLRAPRAT